MTVAIPVLNEERHLASTLSDLASQTYPNIAEVLVVDGGSTDRTIEIAEQFQKVRVLDNPRRIQAAGLNIALAEATGEIFVRVDGHCSVEPDYVECCVDALERTGAAMVGGAMTPLAFGGWIQNGIAAAMASPVGAGPARFHRGGMSGFVDTVYLGAFRVELARRLGGYDEQVGVNEDAEFAHRMGAHGGVWYDSRIRSSYLPRSSLRAVARQFYRYGSSRAATVARHPRSVNPRQLVSPALVVLLMTPWRRRVLFSYGLFLVAASATKAQEPRLAAGFGCTLPAMHLPWGLGFLVGCTREVWRALVDRHVG